MRRLLTTKVWSILFSALTLVSLTLGAAPALTASAQSDTTIKLVVINPPTTGVPFVDVQWQDPTGGWHNIDNWLVPFDQSQLGYTPNYVDPADFGTGPYRWVLFDSLGGKILGTSEPFMFPGGDGDDPTTEYIVLH